MRRSLPRNSVWQAEDKPVAGIPHVFCRRTITTQPEHSVYSGGRRGLAYLHHLRAAERRPSENPRARFLEGGQPIEPSTWSVNAIPQMGGQFQRAKFLASLAARAKTCPSVAPCSYPSFATEMCAIASVEHSGDGRKPACAKRSSVILFS